MNVEGKIVDRREMLRVKLKSLAAEAKIIRHEERKTSGELRFELHDHRINVVRKVARETHIAYGLIRGRTIEQIEPGRTEIPAALIPGVKKMVEKYGPKGMRLVANGMTYV